MMKPTRSSLFLPTCGAVLALALSLVLAPGASAASTVERHQAWTDSLQKVLDAESALTAEQVSTLHAAMVAVDVADFSDRLDNAQREVFRQQAEALIEALDCDTYSALVEGFGDLTPWLATNEVIVAALKCNCGSDDQCGPDHTCKDVECTSEVGTRNWGRCTESPRPIDPDTTEPTSL